MKPHCFLIMLLGIQTSYYSRDISVVLNWTTSVTFICKVLKSLIIN